ncbi:hypothetical protein VFPPC_17492 [Pochonia chlamydosporia 170]|uniref:Uncharacterized protein n=1 Tax=Pochonia chlamydosporia 170 TaxID=1380566 RepID=A0A219AT33_METCM|nr:hypothetical protein VFPPC_17492 [Pochonia chlamydosporia 170]OWT43345.1 hypothetical protein VFPPC_17492 [Pochonia chlamydosporia 170]
MICTEKQWRCWTVGGEEEKRRVEDWEEGREDGGEKRCAVLNFFLRMCDWALGRVPRVQSPESRAQSPAGRQDQRD